MHAASSKLLRAQHDLLLNVDSLDINCVSLRFRIGHWLCIFRIQDWTLIVCPQDRQLGQPSHKRLRLML
jgi:hypothetical protein